MRVILESPLLLPIALRELGEACRSDPPRLWVLEPVPVIHDSLPLRIVPSRSNGAEQERDYP
jgi:hypothetical protein